jgi:putative transposase
MLVAAAGQAAMARVKRHSRVEVATKLAQANDLARQGKLQSEIARTLGVSVMTLHRWRKEDGPNRRDDRIAELQLEISRLRRLVADLLLVKLEEAAQRPKFLARGDEDGHPDKWPAIFPKNFIQPGLGERWPSRLVATAAAKNRLTFGCTLWWMISRHRKRRSNIRSWLAYSLSRPF